MATSGADEEELRFFVTQSITHSSDVNAIAIQLGAKDRGAEEGRVRDYRAQTIAIRPKSHQGSHLLSMEPCAL